MLTNVCTWMWTNVCTGITLANSEHSIIYNIFYFIVPGDLDPQTIWRIPRWIQIKGNEDKVEPRYLPAHHIHRLNPKTKFIVLLRNPVERYAQFQLTEIIYSGYVAIARIQAIISFSFPEHFHISNSSPQNANSILINSTRKSKKQCMNWNCVLWKVQSDHVYIRHWYGRYVVSIQ